MDSWRGSRNCGCIHSGLAELYPISQSSFQSVVWCALQVAGRQEDKTRQDKHCCGPCPLLPNQPWFSVMLRMLVKVPVLMPRNTARLMKLPWDKNLVHPMAKNLRYVSVHLSGRSQFLKSSFNTNPPILQPVSSGWDINILLKHFQSLFLPRLFPSQIS